MTTYKKSITEKAEKPTTVRKNAKKTVVTPEVSEVVTEIVPPVTSPTEEEFKTPHEKEVMEKKNGKKETSEGEKAEIERLAKALKDAKEAEKEKKRLAKELEKAKKEAEKKEKEKSVSSGSRKDDNVTRTIYGWDSEGKVHAIAWANILADGERILAFYQTECKDVYSNVTMVKGFKIQKDVEALVEGREPVRTPKKKDEGEKSLETPSKKPTPFKTGEPKDLPAPEAPTEEKPAPEIPTEEPKKEEEPETEDKKCEECGTIMDKKEEGWYCPLCDLLRN